MGKKRENDPKNLYLWLADLIVDSGVGCLYLTIRCLQGMVNTSEEITLMKNYLGDHQVNPGLCYPYDDWLRGLGKHQDQRYRDLMQQIANWANFYLDDIIEILVCLMIFFKQDQDQETSENIANIGTMWR